MKKVIIIGAGIGGLTAGNLLAQKGHKVTIFESHSMPGGYTAGFYRKGFYFESGTLSFESSPSIFKAMKDIMVLDQIEFVKQKSRIVTERLDIVPESYHEFKQAVYSAYSSEEDNLNKIFNEIDNMMDALGPMNKPMPYLYTGIPFLFSILSYIPGGVKAVKMFKEYGEMTTSEFIGKFFDKNSQLYTLFKGLGYPDMSASLLGGALSAIFSDYWTVKGGMQSWADVLAGNFKKLGGELKLNSYVDRILTQEGRAVGVLCNGNNYYSDYVISAGDYKKTLLKLLDDKDLVSKEHQDKTKSSHVSEGVFTVYLGLGMSNQELGKILKAPHVLALMGDADYNIYDPNDTGFFDKTSISLYSPSMINDKHAPEGKSSLMLQTMVPHHWMQNWGGGDRGKYTELKNKGMEKMIDKASRFIPGLRELIEYKDAATPLTYERFTHNTDGATSSWSWNPKKKFYDSMTAVNVDTPVKNLYIGSCWAMEIGGVPGAIAAAYQCAKKVR